MISLFQRGYPPPARAPTHPLLCGLLALSFIIHSAARAMAFRNTFRNYLFFFPLKKDFRCLIFIVLKKKPTEYVLLLS